MNIETRLKLSYYQEIGSINEAHRVTLVQHRETKKMFVKKVLSTYNLSVYQSLLDHPIPGLPRLYLLHEEDEELTIIEEYLSGDTIEELLTRNGPFSEKTVVSYISELCIILSAMHSRNPAIIHRDIKPSNVMLSPDGRIYLLDLNAARENIAKEEDTKLLGTKGYAAPEQYGFGSSSIRTDIYALGMLMNTMLWGEFRHEAYPSSRLSVIIKNCIQLNPDNRYRQVSQVRKSLTRGMEASELPKNSRQKFVPPGFRTHTGWHMLIAIVVYAFLAWMCLSLNIKDTFGAALYIERIMCLTMFYSIIACIFNYLNIQRLIPLCKHHHWLVRTIGVILLIACVLIIQIFVLFYIETAILKQ